MITEAACGALAACGLFVVYARFIEPYWLKTTVRSANPDPAHPAIRIVHLSDFHAYAGDSRRLASIRSAVQRAIALRPDIICCTGDFATSIHAFDGPALAEALRGLANAAPTFAVLGNHDGGAWASRRHGLPCPTQPVAAMLRAAGIELLDNRSAAVTVRGRPIRVVGVGDMWAQEMDPIPAFTGVQENEEVLLLSHNPDSKEFLLKFPWRWMLSGHTHGGEGVLLGWAPFTPIRDRRYRLGLKRFEDRWIHVTAGLGTLSRFRFGCRPEVSLVLL